MIRPWSASTCRACRSVIRVTPYALLSARCGGSAVPCGYSPERIRAFRSAAIVAYFASCRGLELIGEFLVQSVAHGGDPPAHVGRTPPVQHLSHEHRADYHAVGVGTGGNRVRPAGDAQPEQHPPVRVRLEGGRPPTGRGGHLAAAPGGTHHTHRVDEPAAARGDLAQPRLGGGRRRQQDQVDVVCGGRLLQLAHLLQGASGTISPLTPAARRRAQKRATPGDCTILKYGIATSGTPRVRPVSSPRMPSNLTAP